MLINVNAFIKSHLYNWKSKNVKSVYQINNVFYMPAVMRWLLPGTSMKYHKNLHVECSSHYHNLS